MSILILNSVHHHRNAYEKHLKELGETLVLLTADKYDKGFEISDYDHIESFENYDYNGNVEKRALQLNQKYQFHTVLGDYEYDVLRSAQIRELLGLVNGQTVANSLLYRNKIQMKDRLREHGIQVPTYIEIYTALDLIQFVEKHSYPIVVKPIDGAGAAETFILFNEHDLNELLLKGIPQNMEAETFVDGEMYHVDGFVYNGEIIFVCSSKYLNVPLHFTNGSYTGGFILHPNNPLAKRLNEETCKVVNALDHPQHTSFHAEWFHTKKDELYFCEIASRTGGGRIKETIDLTYHIDLYQTSARANANLPIQFPVPSHKVNKLYGRVMMLKKAGTFIAPPPQKELPSWVTLYEILGETGKHYDAPFNCVDSVATYVVEGDNEADVNEKLLTITEWFEKHARWE